MKTSDGLFRTAGGKNFLAPFILVTSLFFLWGFAHSILDVLNKHFQDTFDMTKTRSALVQAVVYGGYFLMALPAGAIIRRFGYRSGVLTGLVLYGTGALLFIPGSRLGSFDFFLFSLFVIGCGLTCLETAANPYVTVLGSSDTSERRINIAQSFNGLGWIVGPLVGGLCVFSDGASGNIALPYAVIGVIVLLVAVVFSRVKLPEVAPDDAPADTPPASCAARAGISRHSLLARPHFVLGLAALFLYVAAQTGINSFFINYAVEDAGIGKGDAALWLGLLGMGLFMAGRMSGSLLMKYVPARRLLTLCGIGASVAMAVIMVFGGRIGFRAFFLCFLCESIMFPTIFAMAVRDLGRHTKTASSLLIMSIVGGAVAPLLMGCIADAQDSMKTAFAVPMCCFIFITCYAGAYRRLLR